MEGEIELQHGERPLATRSCLALAADFVSLAKPKAMALVVITALTGMALASGGIPPWRLVLATLVGGCLVSAGANALNCYLDRDVDALMARTSGRPLPGGRLRPGHGLVFGLALSLLGSWVLLFFVNPLAAMLATGANAFYVLVYTAYLKHRTDQNVVIGGIAGAMAPLIGYAAVANHLDAGALGLAALVFVWTPPHFWSLALLSVEDYRRAGVPMLPVARGVAFTHRQIVVYASLTAVVALSPAVAGSLGFFYLAVAVALGGGLVGLAARLRRDGTRRRAQALFRYSVLYLGLICVALVADLVLARQGFGWAGLP